MKKAPEPEVGRKSGNTASRKRPRIMRAHAKEATWPKWETRIWRFIACQCIFYGAPEWGRANGIANFLNKWPWCLSTGVRGCSFLGWHSSCWVFWGRVHVRESRHEVVRKICESADNQDQISAVLVIRLKPSTFFTTAAIIVYPILLKIMEA